MTRMLVDPNRVVSNWFGGIPGRTWTERPNPYTVVECETVRARPIWQDVFVIIPVFLVLMWFVIDGFTMSLGSPLPVILGVGPGWSVGLVGERPFWLWWIGHAGVMSVFFATGGVLPTRVERSRRTIDIPDSGWESWGAGLHCVIDRGPLVLADSGLRCRECGRKHTYTGELSGVRSDGR